MSVAFTLTAAPTFPNLTVVKAYPRVLWAGGAPMPGQAPGGVALTSSATVESKGFAKIEGLEPEQTYYVGAEVAGSYRWVTIRTVSEASQTAFTGALAGQSTAVGEGALEQLAIEATVDKGVHTSNTALGWHALQKMTGSKGTFAVTSATAVASSVINLTGVESKAGGAYGGGTSNTKIVIFRKLTPGVTGIQEGVAYFVVGGTANSFEPSLTKGGAGIKVGGVELKTDTEVALLASSEDNTAVGSQAGKELTLGGGNTLVGENAGLNLTTGEENTVVGCEAFSSAQTLNGQVAVGFHALISNKTGVACLAIGFGAQENNESGGYNLAIGKGAMQTNKAGEKNLAIGVEALLACTGSENIAVGLSAGKGITAGGGNLAVGIAAGEAVVTGNENTMLGNYAGKKLTGSGNIALGYKAGAGKTATSNTLVIANNETTPLIEGVLSGTQSIGFFGVTPSTRPEVTLSTVTAKQLAEAIALTGLIKGN